MRNERNEMPVIIGSIIAFFLVCMCECAFGQTAFTKKQKPGRLIEWNSAEFFKAQLKARAFNWQTYPESVDGKTLLTWGLFAAAGVLHGAREAYHADPYVFERVYGVHSESFWGSDAWKRNYHGNDQAQPHKHEIFGNVGRDVWHTFGFAYTGLMFSGTFAIGVRKQPVKYRIANALIGFGARSLFASLTYNSLRSR